MQITVPDGAGWAAMPLLDDQWGHLGVVVKRSFDPLGAPVAGAVRLADEIEVFDPPGDDNTRIRIIAEADTALFKRQVDVHLRGVGNQVDAASISFDGVVVLSFAGVAALPPTDPHNLFGYEPRENRYGDDDLDPFDLAAVAPAVFHSTRTGAGYVAALPTAPLPAVLPVSASSRTGAITTRHADLTLTLPPLSLHVWLYEGGPDRPAFWCNHATVPLVADTVTLTPQGAEVLWRAAVSLATTPLALIRRLDIRKDA